MSDDAVLPDSDPDVQRMVKQKIADKFFVDGVPAPLPPRLRRKGMHDDIRALYHFAKALEHMDENVRRAHLNWLVAKYGPLERE